MQLSAMLPMDGRIFVAYSRFVMFHTVAIPTN
jgi:hypothetical protein